LMRGMVLGFRYSLISRGHVDVGGRAKKG